MKLGIAVIRSLLISVCFLSTVVVLNVERGRLKKSKITLLGMIVCGVVLNELCGLLHELAHAMVAKAFGLEIAAWGGTYLQIPLISKSSPLAQTAVSLGGPLASLIVVSLAWLALNRSASVKKNIVLAYLLFVQGVGGFGSLLYLFSGDAINFAQGLSRLTSVGLGVIGSGLLVASILWTTVVLKRVRGYVYFW